jgi:hypothetical protein
MQRKRFIKWRKTSLDFVRQNMEKSSINFKNPVFSKQARRPKFFIPLTQINPTILSYNASAVKIYNATSNHLRFENKCFLLCTYFEKTL